MFDKKVKIQIKSIFGHVLFEYEDKDNNLVKTLEKAIKSSADLRYADLSYTNLSFADLSFANLRFADLRSADLDMSVFPLWCGSLGIKVDIRLSAQIAYHFCRFETDDEEVKAAQQAIKTLANKFHRIGNDVVKIP